MVGEGSGEEKEECLNLAEKLGDKVVTYGPVSQVELSVLMKQSHIFVLPSFFEGLPLVLLEALACGCRLIATALPGIQEILGDMDSMYIRFVELPRLRKVDTPYEEDEERFEENVRNALI